MKTNLLLYEYILKFIESIIYIIMFYIIAFYIVCLILLLCIFLLIRYRKRIKIIKIPKVVRLGKVPLGDIFTHVYGVLGLVGLTITLVALYQSYMNIENEDFKYVLSTLSKSLVVMVISFILIAAYYNAKLFRYRQSEAKLSKIERDLKTQYIINRYQSELFHSITHYQRNVNARLFEFFQDNRDYKERDIEDIKRRFNDFLIILTSNIQSYFSFITQDNCAVTLKKVSDDKKHVHSFFRDPVNFKTRKQTDDGLENDGQYKIKENTAFRIITDTELKNNFFYEDNLADLAESGNYDNSNPNWRRLYNATIVVPISIVLKKDYRDIIGFVTVDNRKGGLANDTNKEFLFGIGDLLYNIFLKYSDFTRFVESKKQKP